MLGEACCVRRAWWWAVVLGALGVAAAGALSLGERAASNDNAPVPLAEQPKVGDKAPDFETKTLDGKVFHLAEAEGPVLLVFFAPWCPPCNTEAPHLQELHEEYAKQGLHLIAVAVSTTLKQLNEFRKKYGVTYPIGFDERNNDTARAYGVRYIPSTFMIEHTGEISGTWVGFSPGKTSEEVKQAVEQALEKYARAKQSEK